MAQSINYDNVPLYTGQPPARPDSTGFFQPPAPAADGIIATEQARAVAEVQAALVIAASRPRNELQARDRLLQACQRVNLASGAVYQYSRGGTAVSGPSIRLAEAAARAWGNMTYGFRELSRRSGESECEAYAWDLETNTRAVRQFSVRHRRDTKRGGYDLTDERDIYELMANQAQRRVRAVILEIIPGDIMEDAVAQCESTMKANVGDVAKAAASLVRVFSDMGIPREAVEKRLGHRIDAIQPAQIINFRKIYASIRDGMSEPRDWFDLPETPAAAPAGKQEGQAATGVESAPASPEGSAGEPPRARAEQRAALERLRGETKADWEAAGYPLKEAEEIANAFAEKWNTAQCRRVQEELARRAATQAAPSAHDAPAAQAAPAAPATPPAPAAPTAPAGADAPAAEPHVLIECPNRGMIDSRACADCIERDGCPAYAF